MEQNYLNTIRDVLDNGTWQKNDRTGEMCCTLDGAMTRFDISQAFTCAVTTKKLAFKSILGEWIGFLRGVRSAADFRALGSKVWDQNANENAQWLANPFRLGEDDLGDVYGAQWRRWPAFKLIPNYRPAVQGYEREKLISAARSNGYSMLGSVHMPDSKQPLEMSSIGEVVYKEIDQLGDCIRKLILNPSDRRILFHGWNPAKLDEIALPACHLLYQFLPNVVKRELNLAIYIRSWDTFLGGPFNIVEGGLLLELVSRLTGFKPNRVTIFSGDTHVYENHLPMVQEQLSRTPLGAPQLVIDDRIPTYAQLLDDLGDPIGAAGAAVDWLNWVEPTDFMLDGYIHHPELKAQMAV